jgi:hypothetical protein
MEDSQENILARVGGDYVSAALKALPEAETAKDEVMKSIIEVPRFGKVRFTWKRFKHKHRKSYSVFWTATKAAKIDC